MDKIGLLLDGLLSVASSPTADTSFASSRARDNVSPVNSASGSEESSPDSPPLRDPHPHVAARSEKIGVAIDTLCGPKGPKNDAERKEIVDSIVNRILQTRVSARVIFLQLIDSLVQNSPEFGPLFEPQMYRLVQRVLDPNSDASASVPLIKSLLALWESKNIFKKTVIQNMYRLAQSYTPRVERSQRERKDDKVGDATTQNTNSANKDVDSFSVAPPLLKRSSSQSFSASVLPSVDESEAAKFVERERSTQKKMKLESALRRAHEEPRAQFQEMWAKVIVESPPLSNRSFWDQWTRDVFADAKFLAIDASSSRAHIYNRSASWTPAYAAAPFVLNSSPSSSSSSSSSTLNPPAFSPQPLSYSRPHLPLSAVDLKIAPSKPCVFIWDLDGILILQQVLTDSAFAAHQGWDVQASAPLGQKMESLVRFIATQFMFFSEIELMDQTHIDNLQKFDDGQDLTHYDFRSDNLVANDHEKKIHPQKLAYRYRHIRNVYSYATSQVLPKIGNERRREIQDTLHAINQLSDRWLDSAKSALDCIAAAGHINVLVSSSQLLLVLSQCIAYGLSPYFPSDVVYSAQRVSKSFLFGTVISRYGSACEYRVVGLKDSEEEFACSEHPISFTAVQSGRDLRKVVDLLPVRSPNSSLPSSSSLSPVHTHVLSASGPSSKPVFYNGPLNNLPLR